MAAYRRVYDSHVTSRLTAENRDQLQNHTLGNRVRATFFYRVRLAVRATLDREACNSAVSIQRLDESHAVESV